MLRDKKRNNLTVLSQLIQNQIFVYHIKKLTTQVNRDGIYEGFSPFLTLKTVCPVLCQLQIELGSQYWVCVFNKDPTCVFWGLNFSAPKKWFFRSFFLFFEIVPRITPL